MKGLNCTGKRGISTYIAVEILDVSLESTLRPGGVVAVWTTVLEVTVHVRVEMETRVTCKYKEKKLRTLKNSVNLVRTHTHVSGEILSVFLLDKAFPF